MDTKNNIKVEIIGTLDITLIPKDVFDSIAILLEAQINKDFGTDS